MFSLLIGLLLPLLCLGGIKERMNGDGEGLQLSVYSCHDYFFKELSNQEEIKVRNATESILVPLKNDINALLTEIDYMEYTFVQIFHSLAIGDVSFTNELTEVYHKFGKQLQLSDYFKSHITFQPQPTCSALNSILSWSHKGIKPIPQEIVNSILLVTNISSVFDEASRTANAGVIKWLQTYVSESERRSALETAWQEQSLDVVKILIKSNLTFVKLGMSVINRKNEHGESILHLAADLKNPHFVKSLLESGVQVNMADGSGTTPLYRAVKSNDIVTAKILIERQGDVNAETKSGRIPLHEATRNGNLEMVTLLLNSGSTVNKESDEGLTPLLMSEKYVFIETIEYLFWSKTITVKELANNVRYLYVMTSYESANRTTRRRKINEDRILEHSTIAKELILRGEKTYIPDGLKRVLTTLVLKFGIIKLAKSMLNTGPRLEPKDFNIKNIYISAIKNDNHELVSLLLSEGVSENIDGFSGPISSLGIAADHGSVAVFNLLLNRGVNPPKMTNNKRPIFHAACAGGLESVVKNLLNNGSKVDSLDGEHNTPLFYAAIEGKSSIVKLLIKYKADINARNEDNDTPLHYAAISNVSSTVNVLIENGANIEARNNEGETPLFLAASGDNEASLAALIDKGAAMGAKDNANRTPLEVTLTRGWTNSTRILVEKGMNPNSIDSQSKTSLHLAVLNGSLKAVELLLKYGALINMPDNKGWNALHEAVGKRSLSMVQLLVARGIAIDAEDKEGRTPLDHALTSCSRDIASFLAKKGARATVLADPKCTIGN